MTRPELIALGFKEIPHFTVMNHLIYDLGRKRHLDIGCLGIPNEVMYVCQSDNNDDRKMTDLVCLHNYDYDGYLTLEKVKAFIGCFDKKEHLSMISYPELIALGFEEIPHYTVINYLTYNLGRNRFLDFSSLGTSDEAMFIIQRDNSDKKKNTDVICLHRYNYDGYLTLEKVKTLIDSIGKREKLSIHFARDEKVIAHGLKGVVSKVTEETIHVRYFDGSFDVFYFNPILSSQNSIKELRHL